MSPGNELCVLAGFRTLGLVSTFIAGVESQCLGLTANVDNSRDRLVQATNALLLIGLLLSSFGAVTSLFAARWFEGDEVKLLDYRWDRARAPVSGFFREPTENDDEYSKELREKIKNCKLSKRNRIIAKAIFAPFYMIVLYVLFRLNQSL
ncbi:hypothetical protein FRC10_007138 [Ceratobasidium sp. 414]|nr:hypothetical protein FRC10_007138 [Ceratobasidium sp. 414]